jgi:hypothetical protein
MLVKQYWANVWVATYQVFLGVFAGIMFVSPLDQRKIAALSFSAILAIMSWYLGLKTTSKQNG